MRTPVPPADGAEPPRARPSVASSAKAGAGAPTVAQSALATALDDPSAPPPPTIGARKRRRFDVHRNNAAHARIEALRASFPASEKLVGEAFFTALARAFAETEQPTSPLMFEYGGGFPAFIAGFPPAATVPYLADVAQLEWLRLCAYHAADAAPASLADLAALGAEALPTAELTPHPALGLLTSRHPVRAIRAAVMGAGDPGGVDMAKPESIAVTRPALRVDDHLLPPGAAAFLVAIERGLGFGTATGIAAKTPGFDLAATLETVFAIGAIAAVASGPPAAPPEGTDHPCSSSASTTPSST
ncbi:MAG: DNA-binding domain-containing protein [Pseudomonadota bacterium]